MKAKFETRVVEAINTLLKEKEMDEILVRDIAQLLGLTPQGFYYHCRNIPTFFSLCFSARAKQAAAQCGGRVSRLLDAAEEAMNMFRRHREVFLALFSSSYGPGAKESLYSAVEEAAYEVCLVYAEENSVGDEDLSWIRMFVAGELYSLLLNDIRSGFENDPEITAERYRMFTGGGFSVMIRGLLRR